jgi:hypothetical protein
VLIHSQDQLLHLSEQAAGGIGADELAEWTSVTRQHEAATGTDSAAE